MNSISVYTSLFNYSPDKFDLVGAFNNWSKYADEIVIGTFKGQQRYLYDVIDDLEEVPRGEHFCFIKIVECDTSLDDPLFDGKVKNAALQACSNDIVIQQDMDERLGGKEELWRALFNYLSQSDKTTPSAFFIESIDLYKDYNHYKSVGHKWYIHTKQNTFRGPVNFAIREDGTIDTDKSDGCELIDAQGNLIQTFTLNQRFKDQNGVFNTDLPHVIHLGYLDLEKRLEHNNSFWASAWSNLNGREVKIPLTLEELEVDNHAKKHYLPTKWWVSDQETIFPPYEQTR